MRSSDISDAGALGLRAGTGEHAQRSRFTKSTAIRLTSRFWRLPPVTLAVGATAFIAAGLFVAYDTAATIENNNKNMNLVSLVAADVSDYARDVFAEMNASVGGFGNVARASLVAEASPSSNLTSRFEDGALVALEAEDGVVAGIAGRAAIAFGLAGLFTAATLRRRRAEMPDPMQRHNYATLADAIPMGVACWTASGQMIVCNDRYLDRVDIQDGDASYHQAVSQLISGGYMKVIEDNQQGRLLELHRDDGSCLLIDERPLDDGFMTLVSDVTERKRTDSLLNTIREEQRLLARRYHEEKLKAEAASRAKTNFLAHLSHDIRTPLNHIIGFAELMQHQSYGPLGDARYAEYVQTIKSSGEHLLASFAAILKLAELENGSKPLRQDPVLLDEVLATVAQRFEGQAKRAGIRLDIGPSTGAVLRGDRLALVRMAGNIMDNALRFTRAGGHVTLAGFAADDGVVIEISDTGIGMSEERLASLSQPFALGDATFTREGKGPGLGISIARAIAELSGGRLAIDSSPAFGTTVAISLPTDPAAANLVAA